MFILDGKPLSPDRAFTHAGIQYPVNWLRLASPEQRAAIGITEVADEPTYDQRFYWGPNNPKDHTELVQQWVKQTKTTAGSLLAQTDWYITRASETGLAAPQSVLNRRAEIRTLSNEKEALLTATTTTDELAAYITGPTFNVWESTPLVIDTPDVTTGATSGAVISGDDTITF